MIKIVRPLRNTPKSQSILFIYGRIYPTGVSEQIPIDSVNGNERSNYN